MTAIKAIGNLVSWSLSGNHRQHEVQTLIASYPVLVDALQLPRILSNNAYRRAVRAVAGTQGATDDRAVICKVVEDSDSYIVHQFLLGDVQDTHESALTERGARFAHLCATRFDKLQYAAGADPAKLVQVEDLADGLGKEIGDAVLATYHRMAVDVHYSASDLRVAITRAMRSWAGIQMLDTGGLWFIPDAYVGLTSMLVSLVEQLHGCRLIALPQYDVAAVMTEIQLRSSDALDAQLADLLGELERFATGSSVKLSTLEARVEAFDTLRARTECYERLLGTTLGDLTERLNQAQEALLVALSSIKEESK